MARNPNARPPATQAAQQPVSPTTLTIPADDYVAMGGGGADMSRALAVNLDDGLTAFDLKQIKVPTGGGTAWQVPHLGGFVSVDSIDAIIVATQTTRSYWESLEPTQGTPPDCSSPDGATGYGTPGGPCSKCYLSQFGSDRRGGQGQACKQRRVLFLLRPTDIIPVSMPLPPTSLKGYRSYMVDLIGSGLPHYAVVTRFKLIRQEGQRMPYSVVHFEVADTIENPAHLNQLEKLGDEIKSLLARAPVIIADAVDHED